MTQPAVLYGWYSVPVPAWSIAMLAVALLLILAACALDWRRAVTRDRLFCPVHLAQGLKVTPSAAGCPLCLYPERA